jgi:hypothetical protein
MREVGGKYAGFLLGLPFNSEDEDRKFLQNSGGLLQNYLALYP